MAAGTCDMSYLANYVANRAYILQGSTAGYITCFKNYAVIRVKAV